MEQMNEANRKHHKACQISLQVVSHTLVEMSTLAGGITMFTSCSKNVLLSIAYLLFDDNCTVSVFLHSWLVKV